MSKKDLVIVESPTKAKTISRFLGPAYEVASSMGHIRDLPQNKLGVDVEHNFNPQYVITPKAKKVVAELKKRAQNSEQVILATDEDREGEAIAWHLIQALGLDEVKGQRSKVKGVHRIVFHEITKRAIEEALKSPRDIDLNLVDSQQARRILDRLVGYELSPFLWKKVMRGLSAGRVQSVALRLIVEREQAIKKFKPQEYWTIFANLATVKAPDSAFSARLSKIGDRPLKKLDLKNEEETRRIVEQLRGAEFKVFDIQKKEVHRSPAPPLTTSTLQQDCAKKFGYSAKQTMVIAQQLYEGIELGQEGSAGLITYMRTDSVNVAESAITEIKTFILKTYGEAYALTEPRRYKTKSRGAQEAHEAIRPTDISLTPETVKNYLDPRQLKVYTLVWKRTVASQMKEATFDQTVVDISAIPKSPLISSPSPQGEGHKEYTFRATGQIVKFDGFTKVYEIPLDEEKDKEEETGDRLPELQKNEALKLLKLNPKQSFTQPLPRYSDASLVKALEEHGIGRPSTYAPIISTILERKYVERKSRQFFPSEIGVTVNEMLTEHFPQIVDIEFTAKMEEGLDEIAEGKSQWQPKIAEFYKPFKKNLQEKSKTVEKHVEETDLSCPVCGKPMVIKYGRFGKFLACSDFPNCKTTQPLPEEQKKEEEMAAKFKDEKCPECGKPMVVRRGKFGYFLGCSNYPTCRGIKKIENATGIVCPQCAEGELVERRSKRGAMFFACNRYPKCKYTANKLPKRLEEMRKE